MNRRQICWAIPLAWVVGGITADSRAASVAYDDGQSHVIATQVHADVLITDDTRVEVRPGGWIRANLFNPSGAGTRVFDTSQLSMIGGEITSTDSGTSTTGLLLKDSARFEMSGGALRGTTSGPGDAFGLRAEGNSRVVVDGGEVRATTSVPGTATGMVLSGNSMLELSGGTIRATTNGVQAFGLVLNDSAKVRIAGGEFVTYSSSSVADLVANGASRIAIVGTSPFYPQGVPISPLSGQIDGRFADGESFYFSFQRGMTATIVLVPEPASAVSLLSLLVVIGIWRRDRKEKGVRTIFLVNK